MALDDFASDDAEGSDDKQESSEETGSKRTYTKFDRKEFEECLDKTNLDFEEVQMKGTKELVYASPSKNEEFVMLVWSSLDRRTGEARDRGADAIRTVVKHIDTDKPVLREKRTNRIQTWCKNLRKKINSLIARREELKTCPECGRVMVIRKNQKDGSKFWGCTGWAKDEDERDCSNTEPFDR